MEQGRVIWLRVWIGSAVTLLGAASVAWATPALEPDRLPVPPAPAVASARTPALPAVPGFELPPPAGGLHDVRALRTRRPGLLGAELTVKGYVVWIYDCAAALARPGVPAEETRLLIEDNPQLCERPKFYLGASPQTPPEAALWVVDVPRRANKRELIALNAAQLQARPPVPRLAIGDLVAVTGTFTLQSPHGERNSDGLLVYRKLGHLAPSAPPLAVAAKRPVATPEPTIDLEPPLRVAAPTRSRNESIEEYERCNRALDDAQLDAAIASCRRALTWWSGNHLAWYALGNAHAARNDWGAALDAYGRAAQLRPDAAMYQLYRGVAQYKIAVQRTADARRRPLQAAPVSATATQPPPGIHGFVWRPYALATALTTVIATPAQTLDRARRSLATAAQLAPQLWLAWYYLGKTEQARDHAQQAAEAFTRAIQADPTQAEPYLALTELYRAWDFREQSLVVARQASTHATTGKTASLWYQLGMAHEAMRHDADAIAAFSKAIAAGGGSAQALFQRGQVYFRTGDFEHARRDLEAFLASADPSLGLIQQIARSLLVAAARKPGTDQVYLRVPRHYEGQ